MPITMKETQFKAMFNNIDHDFTDEGLGVIFSRLEGYDGDVDIDETMVCVGFSEDTAESVLNDTGFDTIELLRDATWAEELRNGNIVYDKNY